jgi:hypothetical protein
MSEESIQAPKKRTYTRKLKVVDHVVEPLVNIDSDESTTTTDSGLAPAPGLPQKPKRIYKKKVAEPLEILPPPELVRQTNNIRDETELIDSEPETDRVTSRTSRTGGEPREKKPRTEKQQAAFEKMKQARLAKTEELKKLKEIEREQKLLDKEQNKLNTITERVVEKAAAIKQRKSRKPAAEKFDVLPEPQYIPQIQEKTNKSFLFV